MASGVAERKKKAIGFFRVFDTHSQNVTPTKLIPNYTRL